MPWARLERAAVVIAALVLAAAVILLVSGAVIGPDNGSVAGGPAGPGQVFADQGDGPPQAGFRYDSSPPTSGPHAVVPVRAERRALSDDQLLTALAAGDVVVTYGSPRPPASLVALADRTAGPFSPSLAAAGQAVILAPRPGTSGLLALAWTRAARVRSAQDPLLRAFIVTWLGRGAARRPR
jgi:hypothetical protein